MFGSVALMLRHSLGLEYEAAAVESAMDAVLERGLRTPDLAIREVQPTSEQSEVGTAEMTRAVVEELSSREKPKG
jgi:3-isopropylmalate dehydrogenase